MKLLKIAVTTVIVLGLLVAGGFLGRTYFAGDRNPQTTSGSAPTVQGSQPALKVMQVAVTGLTVTKIELKETQLRLQGQGARPGASILIDGVKMGVADPQGKFSAQSQNFVAPASGQVTVSDGVASIVVTLPGQPGAVPPGGGAAPAGSVFKASTRLVPPSPLPPGVAPNGGGRADIEVIVGSKERLKLDIEDVEVIGDAADPEFGRGFYEAVLVKNGVEIPFPAFPGIIVVFAVPGAVQGPTHGALNFDQVLAKGATAIDPRGALLQIYRVEVVRDPVTLKALPGLNGEPFRIAARGPVAVQGVLQ